MKTQQITVRDSDLKAADDDSKCNVIRAIITDQINRHVAMTDTHRAWLADDITTRVLAVIAPLFIARHHAEERATVEKVLELLGKADAALKHHGGMQYTNTWLARDIEAALTALRTASQSPTEGK